MESLRYILFNKPYGVLSNFIDAAGRPALKDFIPVPGIYAAGRLDFDSEGMLLLTNDGAFIRMISDPVSHRPKTYFVQVEGVPGDEALHRLEQGVEIQGKLTRRCQVMVIPEPDLPPRPKPVTPHGPTAWLRIVLVEGSKRQIRHMTAAVSLPALRIMRVAIEGVGLGKLRPGEWRDLTPAEVERLKKVR